MLINKPMGIDKTVHHMALSENAVYHCPWRIHGAAIYGVPSIPLIYTLYVGIYTMDIHGSYGLYTPKKCSFYPLAI